jgi:hypothetical protein
MIETRAPLTLGFQRDSQNEERQGFRTWLACLLLIITLPALAPVYFIVTLIYQFCLVEKLSYSGRFVTLIASVFFAVGWIPLVNIIVYATQLAKYNYCEDLRYFWFNATYHHHRNPDEIIDEYKIEDRINGIAPIVLFVIFCLWALWVAWRHFSIRDSYEALSERQHIQHLKTFEITYSDQDTPIPGISNAFHLYLRLKGARPPGVGPGSIFTLVFTAGIVSALRLVDTSNEKAQNEFSTLLYGLATASFVGIFFVFYSVLTAVVISFFHEVRLIRNLNECLPDHEQYKSARQRDSKSTLQNFSASGTGGSSSGILVGEGGGSPDSDLTLQKVPQLSPVNISHIRAWDEVRRVAVSELTSSSSVFQSLFTPTLTINALGSICSYGYLVGRFFFISSSQTGKAVWGGFTGSLVVFGSTMFLFLVVLVIIARSARKEFKRHTALICRITFQVSQSRDAKLKKRLDQGLCHGEIISGFRLRDEVLGTLTSTRTYMISNPARLKVIGFEVRYLRYFVLGLLLLNLFLLFAAFAIGIGRSDVRCRAPGDTWNATSNSSTCLKYFSDHDMPKLM